MHLCADENIGFDTVIRWREAGHDVLWIREAAPGLPDVEVLQRASSEGRLLLTFDKDFGELAFRLAAASAGIVLFRFAPASPGSIATRILTTLESRADWSTHFSVVDEFAIRMRPLPHRQAP